jgi:hypothetical protein
MVAKRSARWPPVRDPRAAVKGALTGFNSLAS